MRRLHGKAKPRSLATLHRGHALGVNVALDCHDALDQHLGPRRAARHVDVNGDELVAPLDGCIGVKDAAR